MSRAVPAAGVRIGAVFFLHALVGGAIFARIPDIQLALGLGAFELGLVLMGQPVGALVMFLNSSRIIEAAGTRASFVVCLPAMMVSTALIGLAPGAVPVFALMVVLGGSYALANVAMNVEADRVEADIGRRILNTCHGVWSLGFLLTALGGALARGLPVGPGTHLGLMVVPVLLACALVIGPLRPAPPRAHGGSAKRSGLGWPTRKTLLLVGFGVGSAVIEGGSRAWSIIYMRDTFEAPDWVDAMTLPAMLLAMTAGRLVADRWIERFGPARVAGALNLVAMAGLLLVILAPSLHAALAGFALLGLGLCATFPLMLSAGARLGDRPASENVSSITLVVQLTVLGVPALLGAVAEAFGIRAIFAVMLPLLVLSRALSRQVGEAKP